MKDGRRSESPSIFHRKQKSFFLTQNLKRKYWKYVSFKCQSYKTQKWWKITKKQLLSTKKYVCEKCLSSVRFGPETKSDISPL